MKKWYLFAIIICIIGILFFLYKGKEETKVYSFSGSSDELKIHNGVIILSPKKQVVYGGEVEYIGPKRTHIKTYFKSIYLNDEEAIVLKSSVSNGVKGDGLSFPAELKLNKENGSISSEELLTEQQIKELKENLYYQLEMIMDDGENIKLPLRLEVHEIK
ncbi:hypothetical protein ACQKL5_13170 [Peribacillus sp. NPDC097675]|uniref:hypothetical protein n=1 Tax=Peribacillus sp. NPDC097675 TaxID=3390618 RepID=UPI003D03AD5F